MRDQLTVGRAGSLGLPGPDTRALSGVKKISPQKSSANEMHRDLSTVDNRN